MAQRVLSVVSGIFFLVAFVPYIIAILRKQTKPAKVSWIIWASLDSITLAGMAVQGTLNYQILGAVCGAWIVTVLAVKFGTKGWTKLDKFALLGAVLGIVLWKSFSSATLGILTSSIVVIVGSFPTFTSAWHDPSKENKLAWTLMFTSCVLALFVVPKWDLDNAAQPVAFTIIETTMVLILWIRPHCMVSRISTDQLSAE